MQVYAIVTKPSDNRHVKHEVCVFSTKEAAQTLINCYPNSYDPDDKCGWTYEIEIRPKDYFDELDKGPPSDFPYIY